MPDNIWERQQALNLTIPKSVAVIGCGGVGSWVAYLLAMAGVENLWLFDSDTVSETNLNRIPLSPDCIGETKSKAMETLIDWVRPKCKVHAMGHFFPDQADLISLGAEVECVVVTTDTLASRQLVSKWADKNRVTYFEAAAEGEIGSATGEGADFSTPEEIQSGYASVPVHCLPCVLAAAIAVNHVIHGMPMGERTIRMGWEEGRFDVFDSHPVESSEVDFSLLEEEENVS